MSTSIDTRITGWFALAAAALLAVSSGCTTLSGGGVRQQGQSSTNEPTSHTDCLTQAEIAATGLPTAYEVVERLRPSFLQDLRVWAGAPRTVYLDGIRLGGLGELRSVDAHMVLEIRLLSPRDATMRFGAGNDAGAIVVVSGRP
jgi:hypothetical protein